MQTRRFTDARSQPKTQAEEAPCGACGGVRSTKRVCSVCMSRPCLDRRLRSALRNGAPLARVATPLFAFLCTLWSVPVSAQPKPEETCPAPPFPTGQAAENRARKIFQYAVGVEATSPREAFELYKCARKLSDRPVIALRLGTLGDTLGEVDTALVALTHYLELAGADAPDADEIKRKVEALRAKKRANDPSVVVDGTPLETEPKKAPPPPPPKSEKAEGMRTRTIVGLATAGAGVIIGGVGGYLLYDARNKSEDLAKTPPGRVLWDGPQGEGKLDQAKSRQTLGIVGISAGGAIAITGLVLCLTGSAGPPKNVELSAAPLPGGFVTATTLRF